MKKASSSMMRKWMWQTLAVCIGTAVLPVLPASGQWYVEMGPAYRRDMQISVQGGSRAAENGVGWDWTRIGVSGSRPTAKDSLLNDDGSQAVLRQFDDGYVGPSGWQWARDAGVTQFWGYENASQYDAVAETLQFQSTLTDTVTARHRLTHERESASGWSDSRSIDGAGAMATIGYMISEEGSYPLALQFRVGWLDDIRANFRNRKSASFSRRESIYESTLSQEETYSYTYDTLGNPAIPTAPYAMSDPAGVGPMIADRPQSIDRIGATQDASSRLVGLTTSTWNSYTDLDIDAQALLLQAGPRLIVHATESVSLLLQPFASLNMIDVDARRMEVLRDASGAERNRWADRNDDQVWRAGVGLQVGAIVDISESFYLVATGGYDWVDSFTIAAGPDRVRIDISGYQAELAVGFEF